MQLFYTSSSQQPGDVLNLSEEESWHCAKVLRLRKDDSLHLTEGQGSLYRARILDINSKSCRILIEHCDPKREKPPSLHIAIAPTKNSDRFEWFLEKATEIGIGSVTPILCDHSERLVIKKDRLEKILIAAMKQSQRLWLPVLNDVSRFTDLIAAACSKQRYIAHCGNDNQKALSHLYIPHSEVTILIGPEGDFSDQEITHAKQAGFVPVSLGNARLRIETAGIVAAHTINLLDQMNSG
ncbi:MAG: 16S rRNA (uracil(1498)-N(3))-methyltransferase [Alphaproteobacteria bacterium]|nr:16S rRNA (uracil(1498)-N(3))-methyltransferase [Alphaproteobacteria bacterium]